MSAAPDAVDEPLVRPQPDGSDGRLTVGFDLDGVLMRNPFETCVIPRFQDLMTLAPALAGLSHEEARAEARRRVGLGWRRRMAAGDEVGAYDWDGIYRDVAEELGAAVEIDVAAWVRDCCSAGGHIEALPGAHELLARLSAANTRLVVVSNGYAAYQVPVLEALGLLSHFGAVVTPEVVGAAKPDPAIFLAAGTIDVFVGDTLEHDMLGAKRAGAFAVWVKPNLPPSLAALEPRERAAHPDLEGLLETTLALSPHGRFQAAANVESCRPDAVVRHLDELAELVLVGG